VLRMHANISSLIFTVLLSVAACSLTGIPELNSLYYDTYIVFLSSF
jgi:hypothetical protein